MTIRHRDVALAAVLLLGASGAERVRAQACGLPAWTSASALPSDVYGLAVAAGGSHVYAAGGLHAGVPSSQFARYSPSSNTWSALAPLPTPVYMATLAHDAAGGRLFLFGGTDATNNPTTLVQVYTIASDSWAAGPSLPGSRSQMASAAVGSYIYLIGGYASAVVGSAQSQTWRFNPATGAYTAMASLTEPLGGAGATAYGSYVLLFGGRNSSGTTLDTSYLYSTAGNTWNLRAPLPQATNAPAAVTLSGITSCDNDVLVVGGGAPFREPDADAPTTTAATYAYDIGSNSWTSGPALATGRSFAGAAQAEGTVVAVGGYSGAGALASVERLRVPAGPTCRVRSQGTWAASASFPSTLARPVGVFFPRNGKFYVLGGRSTDGTGTALLNPVELSPESGVWATKTATFPDSDVSNMVGGILDVGGRPVIALVGGSSGGGTTASAAVRYYDPVADTLTVVTTDPWPGNGVGDVLPGGAGVYGNKLYVFGGFQINVGMTGSIWQYDPAAAAGSRWSLRSAFLPAGLGYIPTAQAGGYIYLLGGSTYSGGALIDGSSALRYDPVGDAITALAAPPRALAETRALTQADGTVWVLSGGRTAPNPTIQVDVYVPGTDTWSAGPALTTARRNFAADVDQATGRMWAVGGYVASAPGSVSEELRCLPKGDIDRDGWPDLIFRSTSNGAQNKVWIMNGVVRASETAVSPDAASADWKIRGADDFDGDGRTDLVFWNQSTGNVEFWLMNGATRVGAPVPLSGGAVLPTNWDLAATADFDHDGRPDIVWRNFSSQKIVIWTMASTAKVGNVIPSPDQAVDANWMIVAALDYNSDGNTDFLWYNSTSGKIVTWYMNASVVRTSGQFTTPANAGDNNWRVLASSDYSRAYVPGTPPYGTPDIVWRNETSGNQVVWHLDFASNRVHGEFTNPSANTPALDWTIVGPR